MFGFACNRQREVKVVLSDNVIAYGDTLVAELYVNSRDSIINYRIFIGKDTFLLPIDEERVCAIFKSVGRKKGINQYSGDVEIVDDYNKKEYLPYSFDYFVK